MDSVGSEQDFEPGRQINALRFRCARPVPPWSLGGLIASKVSQGSKDVQRWKALHCLAALSPTRKER